MDGWILFGHPPPLELVYILNLGSGRVIMQVQKPLPVPRLVLSDIEFLLRQDTLNFKCAPTALFCIPACQFDIKYCHKTPKPCKKELQTKWWLAENINLGHLGWLVAYCLNNRILTLWELKQEISAHLVTTGSDQHAKH